MGYNFYSFFANLLNVTLCFFLNDNINLLLTFHTINNIFGSPECKVKLYMYTFHNDHAT